MNRKGFSLSSIVFAVVTILTIIATGVYHWQQENARDHARWMSGRDGPPESYAVSPKWWIGEGPLPPEVIRARAAQNHVAAATASVAKTD